MIICERESLQINSLFYFCMTFFSARVLALIINLLKMMAQRLRIYRTNRSEFTLLLNKNKALC